MKNLLFTLLIPLSLFSCSENNNLSLTVLTPFSGQNSINLSAPQESQKSVYVRYYATCQSNLRQVTFSGDTLALTIKKENDNWIFTERLNETSPLVKNGEAQQTSSYTYQLENQYGLLKERGLSQLFFFYGNDTLFLENQEKISLVQSDCQLTFNQGEIFIGEEIGHLEQFKVGQIIVKDKDAVSCIPEFFNFEAYLIYNKSHLSLSHVMIGEDLYGWVQIE